MVSLRYGYRIILNNHSEAKQYNHSAASEAKPSNKTNQNKHGLFRKKN